MTCIVIFDVKQMDHLMSLDKEIILRQGTIQEPFYWGHFEPFHVS